MSTDGNAESPSGREGPDHGPTIDPVTKDLRRTSVSQMQLADYSTSEGCLRKWWYERVRGRKEPSTEAQDTGKKHHRLMEGYLTTGIKSLPDRILCNLHFVPRPGPDLLIEHPTIPTMSDGSSGLAYAPLRAAGVPVVGYIDCIDGRLETPGVWDLEDTRDPPGTIHVRDWKFTASLEYAKTGPELVKTIQMAGYGKYRFDVGWPGDLVRLSHGYFPKKGRGELRTIRVDRTAVERSWEHAESVVRSMRDAARESDPEKVPANRRACRAYGKQCIHAADGYCTAGMHDSLRQIVGARASQALITTKDSMAASILERIRGTGATPNAPTPPPVVTVSLTGVTPDPFAAETAAKAKAAEIERLKAEEQEQRAAKQFDAMLSRVQEHGVGMPAFSGDARALYKVARPSTPDHQIWNGSGQLATVDDKGVPFTITDPADLTKLLAELDTLAAQRAEAAKEAPAPGPGPLLAPEALMPVAAPMPAVVPTAPTASKQAEPEPAGRRKTRAPKAEADAEREPVATGRGPVNLVVDCALDGVTATSLHGLIDEWCDALAKQFDAADIRCAPEKSPLGFGKWPGALMAFVRETATELPTGWYTIDSRGGSRFEVVIEALRPVIRATGGVLIRGAR